MEDLADRFLAKVWFKPGCWEWVGSRRTDGYGQIRVGSRLVKAHQVAYELFVGPIPPGIEIDHTCRNHGCVRHLEAVPHQVNVARGTSPHGLNAQKTRAACGHPFDAVISGCRRCSACYRAMQAESQRRRRAA